MGQSVIVPNYFDKTNLPDSTHKKVPPPWEVLFNKLIQMPSN